MIYAHNFFFLYPFSFTFSFIHFKNFAHVYGWSPLFIKVVSAIGLRKTDLFSTIYSKTVLGTGSSSSTRY